MSPLKSLAKSQFGLILELAHHDEAFLKTTQRFEGSSSADMGVLAGYCMLSVWPHNVARSFESQLRSGVDDAVVLRVVVMHELGHCVDMCRDGGSFADAKVTPKSVAPNDVASVHDVASLYQAGRKRSTNQWRGVYARLFAVGYARIAYPAIAPAIAQWLSGPRRATADIDLIHATACWVDASSQVAAPQSLAALPGWADRQRAGAPCKLSQNEPG